MLELSFFLAGLLINLVLFALCLVGVALMVGLVLYLLIAGQELWRIWREP